MAGLFFDRNYLVFLFLYTSHLNCLFVLFFRLYLLFALLFVLKSVLYRPNFINFLFSFCFELAFLFLASPCYFPVLALFIGL